MEDMKKGPVVPIIIERLDFFSAEKVKTLAITFNKSLDIFKEFEKVLPFNTDCIVFKENGKISFKVIGIYNTGLIEELYSLEDHILNNDEEQIIQLYESNYKDIRSWVGNINSNMYDVKNI
ncbi:hypothetical protein JCM19300_4198 [Algibacter lectus]|uniref:Uncharacterized protein n=2 Tax=Algibacter lectus TaxID=221126 RepID=A0A090W141_9FLAO|nr:hypothetical protein JCM19300_4198 [Algibacter lectus]